MKVILIDDHMLFAKSLEITFADYAMVEEFFTVSKMEKIEEILDENNIDIVLMDVNLGNMSIENGLYWTEKIIGSYPNIKIIILSGYDLPVYRYEAKKIGAKGFVNKNVDPKRLVDIMQMVDEGMTYFKGETEYIEELTKREREILVLLSEGYKRKDISKMLFISERTVSNFIQSIFNKLEVNSAIEAVTEGYKLGYITPCL